MGDGWGMNDGGWWMVDHGRWIGDGWGKAKTTFHYPLLTTIRSLYCVIHYQSQKGVRGIEHRFFLSQEFQE